MKDMFRNLRGDVGQMLRQDSTRWNPRE